MQILCIPLNQDRSLLSSQIPLKIACTELHVHPLTAESNRPNIELVTLINRKIVPPIKISVGCFPPCYHAVGSAWPPTEVSSLLLL
jgi:hypothetical protein